MSEAPLMLPFGQDFCGLEAAALVDEAVAIARRHPELPLDAAWDAAHKIVQASATVLGAVEGDFVSSVRMRFNVLGEEVEIVYPPADQTI